MRSPSRIAAFRFAFAGIAHAIRTQRNMWIHLSLAMGVTILGSLLKLDRLGWAMLVLTFGLVLALEMINTVVEAIVDLASPEYHPLAKVAKDVAAGAVLTGAIVAVIVGLLILGPPLWDEILRVAGR